MSFEMNFILAKTKVSRLMALGALSVALAACNTATNNQAEDTLGISDQQDVAEEQVNDQSNNLRAFCPRAIIRGGTETHRTFVGNVKKDDPGALNSLKFQSTITEVARECNYSPNNLNMRIGIKGRVINGPTGHTGTINVPVRVAVANTANEVLYSILHQVPVTIPEGGSNALFSYVDSGINIPPPENSNLIVYVGFDEGPPS
jgi:hypothetical protein